MELKNLPYYNYLKESNPQVIIKVKDFGKMTIELFPGVALNTVNNFISYVKENKYSQTNFHRIIKDFMIQGGEVDNPNNPIKGEFSSNGYDNNLKHYKGIISMARTAVKDSATSQFFIIHKTSPHLDGGYASFGGLIKGFDVLDKIAETRTDYLDRPYEDVVIEEIKLK